MQKFKKFWVKLNNIFNSLRYYNLYKRNIRIRGVCFCYVSDTANLNITKKFIFNQTFNDILAYRNPYIGHLYIADNATISIHDVAFITGGKLEVNKDAIFSWKSGYINQESTIICSKKIQIG